jgi:hypothetical protein
VEQSASWEARSHSSSQEILHLLGNPNVYYRVHKSSPLVPILSQMHPVHNLPPYFHKINSNIFSSTPRSCKWSLLFRFSNQNIVCISHKVGVAVSNAASTVLHSNRQISLIFRNLGSVIFFVRSYFSSVLLLAVVSIRFIFLLQNIRSKYVFIETKV